ncbi:MAG: NADPH:quinone reductase [Azospira oryzae]|uniref:Quinone oxidoreductase n=1 Tax=Pelomicrobium methylotrophicum TaxID=2602750 RepID=A0A5C7F0K3_9PROT|nr:quinone oxidoreductase [Pelomicrobium methylotrophicum]PZP57873.1 MAG: NADPH:quinone reductase [Azospira oryzae]PZP79470.1 MAG: NADPH:quinone reductase [Azospira oryzae]TXF13014.1 quinone oxidoreductase [Pelomicrobium methylotrophicum]
MKAIRVFEFGGPEQLRLAETEVPQPKEGEALVKLAYAGVNFIDVYMRNGSYARSRTYQTPLPMTLGMEGVGEVVEAGPGVERVRVGDRVGYCLVRGSYAEYAVVPAWRLARIPEGVPDPIATTLMLQGCTAHYLSHSVYELRPGSTCLVHAGAGGVGQLLIQLAKLRGATVLTTVGSADKAQIAKARGADHVILYRERDFREAVMEITGGKGVDVVYDAVGKDTIARSIRSLRRRGLCVNYGGASGLVASIEPLELGEAGSVYFTRPHLADYTATTEEIEWRTGDLFRWYLEGKLTVVIDREYPLAEAAEAHRHLEGRGTRGKLLLKVTP